MINAPDKWFAEIENQEALTALRHLSGESISVLEGPQSIGSLQLFYRSSGSKVAQHYLAAFEQGIRSFPYFTD